MRKFLDFLACALIAFEILVLILAIHLNISIREANVGTIQLLYRSYIADYQDDVDTFNHAEHPLTKVQIKYLFHLDNYVDYSEIGGYVTLADEGYLRFHVYPSKHVMVWHEFISRVSVNDLVDFVEKNDLSQYGRNEAEINRIQMFPVEVEMASGDSVLLNRIVLEFRNWFKDLLNKQYNSNIKHNFKFHANSSEPIVGRFHLHPYETGPSSADMSSSYKMKSVMIEPRGADEFVIWSLIDGTQEFRVVRF